MDAWNFRWDTVALDGLFSRQETGWMLQGRNFVSPGLGWAIAHDVFHHAPNDTGSFAEEVASFGAQTLFEPGEGLQSTLATSLFSVMALVIENGTRGVEGLFLPAAPLGTRPGVHDAMWTQCFEMAIAEARDTLGEWAEPAVWDRLVDPVNKQRALGWMRHGHAQAARRFPDIEQARRDFARLEILAGPAAQGELLRVEIENGAVRAVRQDASPQECSGLGQRVKLASVG